MNFYVYFIIFFLLHKNYLSNNYLQIIVIGKVPKVISLRNIGNIRKVKSNCFQRNSNFLEVARPINYVYN